MFLTYFEQYVGTHDEVVSDTETIVKAFDMTPAEMSLLICDLLDLKAVDLFEELYFEATIDGDALDRIIGCTMVVELRALMFSLALRRGIGLPGFNDRMLADSLAWSSAFQARWTELCSCADTGVSRLN